MPTFNTLDNTYLDKSITRIMGMIHLATPYKTQVISYIDPKMEPPFWWIYPGPVNMNQIADDEEEQEYDIIARHVIGFTTQGYDGNLGRQLWTVIPRAINYINGHKQLIYEDNQAYIPYLQGRMTRARQLTGFGELQGYEHLGVEIAISLLFTVQIDQEW